MYKIKFLFSALIVVISINSFAQGVSINNDESDADPSAILDVKSSTQGMLVPRMTVAQAYAISNPAEGLLLYATDVESFLYYKSANWNYLTSEFARQIADFDFDTKITTGGDLDDDTIRFFIRNSEVLRMDSTHIELLTANIFIGEYAGRNNTTGVSNIAMGRGALFNNDSISGLVAIGDSALCYNYGSGSPLFMHGEENTAVGNKALMYNGTGSFNTALGYEALKQNDAGHANTAIGAKALNKNKTLGSFSDGNYNTAVGASVLEDNVKGNSNAALGSYALKGNVNGNDNCAFGCSTLFAAQKDNNCAFGNFSLQHNWGGASNVAFGFLSLQSNQTGNSNVAIGTSALQNNSDISNIVAIGDSALFNNGVGAASNEGTQNTAVGSKSLYSNNTGFINTALGFEALYNNTSGDHNTAIGALALYYNSDGIYNTSAGVSSLAYNQSGSYNAAFGNKSLHFNQYGSENTAIGNDALSYNTASSNTALGHQALLSNSIGTRNTAVGSSAGIGLETGYYNTFIGAYTSSTNVAYNNSIALGDAVAITASNQVRIGDVGVTSIGGYASWTNISDKRFKENVKQNVPGLEFILLLQPVTYHLNLQSINEYLGVDQQEKSDVYSESGKENETFSGFLAQDVEKAAQSVNYEFSGIDTPQNENNTYGLRYAEFVVPLVKAMQEQQAMIEDMKAEIESLKSQLNK